MTLCVWDSMSVSFLLMLSRSKRSKEAVESTQLQRRKKKTVKEAQRLGNQAVKFMTRTTWDQRDIRDTARKKTTDNPMSFPWHESQWIVSSSSSWVSLYCRTTAAESSFCTVSTFLQEVKIVTEDAVVSNPWCDVYSLPSLSQKGFTEGEDRH